MRIYELAKEIGMDSKELLERLKKLNFPVKNHMSSVDPATAEIIKHEIDDIQRKEIEINVIEVNFPISVKDLSVKLSKKPSEILKVLMQKGKFFSINYNLEEGLASEIAYMYKVNLRKKISVEEQILNVKDEDMEKRAPVVTLMG
ncbi:MAG: translation initiation factor IF-2 N-terminal domain-containing protein, partial [Candidatus Omnitrophota bacterium]